MYRAYILCVAAITLCLLGTSCRDEVRTSRQPTPKAGNASEVSPNYEVRRFVAQIPYKGGSFEQNVYLLFDRASKQCVIIDPGARNQELETLIARSGFTVEGILNTHGHFDHTGANGFYGRNYQAEVYAHSSDKPLYQRDGDKPTRWIAADCNLRLGDLQVHVLQTPGHSAGSVCFVVGNYLFSGDTLFKGSIGRTHDEAATIRLVDNVRKKLLTLPPETRVYPGHGDSTTIAEEKRSNPFLQDGQ